MTKLRFAPAPTGYMHIGNARIAIMNYILGKCSAESMVLRFDDTNTNKIDEIFVNNIKTDLQWLGIQWGEVIFQSQRLKLYNQVLEQLKKLKLVYSCYETVEELDYARKIQQSLGKPPVYDRKSLYLSAEQKKRYEQQGRKPYWRFKLNDEEIKWKDLIFNHCCYNTKHISDPILTRSNGDFLYMLPSIIDDNDMKISHIVRGSDHLTNTAVQIQIMKALNYHVPNFAHLPLVKIKDTKLSKRNNDFSIKDMREKHFLEPEAIYITVAYLGTGLQYDANHNWQYLADNFDLNKISCNSPQLDMDHITTLNKKIIANMDDDTGLNHIHELGIKNASPKFWNLIKNNIKTIQEVKLWYNVIYGDIDNYCHNNQVIAAALTYIPETWDENTWNNWVNNIIAQDKNCNKLDKKTIYTNLRTAITGQEKGPEMSKILPLIDTENIISRLQKIK